MKFFQDPSTSRLPAANRYAHYSMTVRLKGIVMIYVLHFSEKIHHAGHYTGCCADGRLDDRLLEHRNGYGAKLTRAAIERGIKLHLGATLPGGYLDEKLHKNMHNGPRYCNICRQRRLLEKMGL